MGKKIYTCSEKIEAWKSWKTTGIRSSVIWISNSTNAAPWKINIPFKSKQVKKWECNDTALMGGNTWMDGIAGMGGNAWMGGNLIDVSYRRRILGEVNLA